MSVTAGVLVSVVLAPAASAAGSTTDNAFTCSGAGLSIPAPRVWTVNSTPESVFWSPTLFRWQNNQWVQVVRHGWSTAAVNNQGFAVTPWVDMLRYDGAASRSFDIHQPGYYAVANMVVWTTGPPSIRFAPSAYDNANYCYSGGGQRPAGSDLAAEVSVDPEPLAFHFSDAFLVPASILLDLIGDELGSSPDLPPAPS